MTKSISILLFAIIASLGCLNAQIVKDTANPNGYNVFHYPNGQKLSEGYLKNGKPDGYWITYYPNGIKKSEGNRKNYLLDSLWIFYNEQGDTLEKINYVFNEKNGYYYKYYTRLDSGVNSIKSKELYLNNKIQGWAYYYYPNGKLHFKIHYKDNYKNGKGFEYDKNGRLIAIDEYRNNNLISRQAVNRYNSKGQKDGKWVELFDDGTIKSEINYANNLPNGLYKEYTPNGKILKIERYENGILKAEAKENDSISLTKLRVEREYYKNGKIKAVLVYKDSLLYGKQLYYDENGNIKKAEIYNEIGIKVAEGQMDTMGRRQGKWQLYYDDGTQLADGNYLNNKKSGKWVYYYSNGKILEKGSYINDLPNGQWTWYYQTGQLLLVENFKKGVKDGISYELDITGDTIAKGYYAEGTKNDFWYYKIGDEYSEGKYYFGEKSGEWKYYYYPEMNIKKITNYKEGKLDGKYKSWYKNKKQQAVGQYQNDLKSGKWYYYLPSGTLDYTAQYKNGKLYKVNDTLIE